MLDLALIQSVALQMMERDEVMLGDKTVKVERTSYQRLKTVTFKIGCREYQAIEQNADKPSQWGSLAREGHKVVQVRERVTGKYVAVVVDGTVREYERR
ncbi:MAG TPA: hypothetical protein VMB18_11830 [Terriglobales bacterium]|nr:hypothetical protein [Terriglobales bacterium]